MRGVLAVSAIVAAGIALNAEAQSPAEGRDAQMIEAKPERLVGDKAYDSDELDERLEQQGIEMIAPHRANRKTQDDRALRRYARRWLVERFFAWLQWKRRLLVRWEYYAANFLGFVQLASISMMLKPF